MPKRLILDCVEITLPPVKKPRLSIILVLAKKVSLTGYSLECPELDVPGETDPLKESKDDDSVPVRLLDNFRVFDSENNMVPFERLLSLSSYEGLQASGHVSPYLEAEDDSDDDDDESSIDDDDNAASPPPILIYIPALTELSLHHFDTTHGCRGFDSNIYLLTECAWYVLGVPHKSYIPFYKSFAIHHATMHFTLLQCCVDPTLSYDKLKELFKIFVESKDPSLSFDDYDLSPEDTVGRPLSMKDFSSSEEYMQKTFTSWSQSEDKILRTCELSRHPVVKYFVPRAPQSLGRPSFRGSPTTTSSSVTLVSKPKKPTSPKLKKAPVENTVVTQRVKRIAAAYGVGAFKKLLQLHRTFTGGETFRQAEVQAKQKEARAKQKQSMIKDHPNTMYWISASTGVDNEGRPTYNEVELDDEVFRVGDVVMVLPGDDDDPSRIKNRNSKASTSANANMNHFWFCEIQYFYEDKINTEDSVESMMFHARWFQPGAQLILQEAAHSQELILINECNDLHLSCIVQKVSVNVLDPHDEIPEDERDPAGSEYYCTYQVGTEGGFVDAVPFCKDLGCYSCNANAEAQSQDEPAITSDPPGLSYNGYKFHQGDFLLLAQPGSIQLRLAWIFGISMNKREIQLDVTYWSIGLDPLNQFYTEPSTNTGRVSATTIIRPCYVKAFVSHQAAALWCQEVDHFYTILDDEDTLSCCDSCLNERAAYAQRRNKLRKSLQPLPAMELFAGCGGLGTGLIRSGLVNTKWAVELDESAALTFQVNHPDAVVFAESVNVVLDNVLQIHNGKKVTRHLKNPHNEVVKPPRRGEVEVITAGAPCQSFSRANRHKKKEDVRSTLLCSFLSYVEYYGPKLAMIENVPGMLGHRFERDGEDGEIDGGMIKFLYRSLMELGYQVNHKVLQAGQYGSPQARQRVIFIAARRGFPMPKFPTPTHAFPGGAQGFWQPDFTRLEPLTHLAPFAPITVNESISDLPPFHWACPKQKNCHDRKIANSHSPRLDTQPSKLVGYDEDMPYPVPPQNYYQKSMRIKQNKNDCVSGHQTARFTELVVERTVHVAIKPLADHRSLPEWLRPSLGTDKKPNYRRLDGDGHFRTAMTNMNPQEIATIRLHPSQRRVLSVREVARSQGFPDEYIFRAIPEHSIKIKYRQLGNAVPVPLATALGRSLGEAYLTDVEQRTEEQVV